MIATLVQELQAKRPVHFFIGHPLLPVNKFASWLCAWKGTYVLMNAGIIPLICHPKTWKTNSRLNIQSNASLVLIDVIEFLERTKNCENPEAKLRSRRCGKNSCATKKFVFLLHIRCLLYNAIVTTKTYYGQITYNYSNEMVCVV